MQTIKALKSTTFLLLIAMLLSTQTSKAEFWNNTINELSLQETNSINYPENNNFWSLPDVENVASDADNINSLENNNFWGLPEIEGALNHPEDLDRNALLEAIQDHCSLPIIHPRAKLILLEFISQESMLNTAFARVFVSAGSRNLRYLGCIMRFIDRPIDREWEPNLDFDNRDFNFTPCTSDNSNLWPQNLNLSHYPEACE